MNATVEKTLQMPTAVLIVRELEAALEAEQKKRQCFYETIDKTKKMEFINGEIYFQSPAKLWHTQAVGNLSQLLGAHVAENGLGIVATEKMHISLSRNDYEPDLCFFTAAKAEKFSPKQMQCPAPDFVVEVISESTERHDRITKFRDYAGHGVGEYWIVDPENEIVEQYMNRNAKFEMIPQSGDGHIKSVVIQGFSIPINAIFEKEVMMDSLKRILGISSIDQK